MKNFFCVLIFAALLFTTTACVAEDLKFIDAEDDTGYFIDVDTIRVENDSIFTVNMAVIRINLNQMDVVDLRINHRAKSYVVRSIKTFSYDERTLLKTDNTPRSTRTFADESVMGDLVRFVLWGSPDAEEKI